MAFASRARRSSKPGLAGRQGLTRVVLAAGGLLALALVPVACASAERKPERPFPLKNQPAHVRIVLPGQEPTPAPRPAAGD